MSLPIRLVESGLLVTGQGKLKGIVVNSHTSGTVKIWDSASPSVPVQAVSDLTSSGAVTVATHATTGLTSSGASVPGTHAVSVLTGDAVVDGNVVVIGSTTYTARTAFTYPTVANEVLLGANLTAFLVSLVSAINGTLYGDARQYSQGTVAHTQVVAVASDATTLTVRGRVPGTSLNTVATTGTALRTVWADTTLGGGTGASDAGVTTAAATFTIDTITYTVVDALSETYGATAVAYQILKGASEAAMLDNIKLAVNATGTAGTNYSTGTLVHPTVVATTNTDTVQTFRGRVPGTSLNTVVTTETMANTAFADTTLGGGTGISDPGVATTASTFTINGRTYTAVIELSETLGATAVADQILWVTSEAVFLDKIKLAINASGTAGTDYSTGTTANVDVTATTNTDTVQTFVARKGGTGGNSLTTTETMGNYAWTSTVMASGLGSTSTVLFNTITPIATASLTSLERMIDLGGVDFSRGLYVTVGGTLDATLVVDTN